MFIPNNIAPGSHIISIYKTLGEQFQIAVPVLNRGLTNNDKCIYICDTSTKGKVSKKFNQTYIKSGQLEIADNKSVYLTDNMLDINKMIGTLKMVEQKAIKDGYDKLIIAGELPILSGKILDTNIVFDYEATADKLLKATSIITICNYCESKYPPGFLAKVLKVHQYVAIYGKLYDNKYFYNFPDYLTKNPMELTEEDYRATISSIITD